MTGRLLIVGDPSDFAVGHHFEAAARELGLTAKIVDSKRAYSGPWFLRKLNWHLRGHLPSALSAFSLLVKDEAEAFRPDWILTTGLAPIAAGILKELSERFRCAIYLTDDPWNPAHSARWFFPTLPLYAAVHTTRRANVDDLRGAGCREVIYTPFAYNPAVHYPETFLEAADKERFAFDVFLAGGADPDRVQLVHPLLEAGFRVGLFGGYWERFAQTRGLAGGMLSQAEIRKAVLASKVHLGLVRRANRDGHAMRSFELPAMGGCCLMEDTPEHRELFGTEGDCVYYFANETELVEKTRTLLSQDGLRQRLSQAARRLISTSHHTYKDRLQAILGLDKAQPPL